MASIQEHYDSFTEGAIWIVTLATTTTHEATNASALTASAEMDLTTIGIGTTGGNARSRLAVTQTTLAISRAVLAIRGNRTAASRDTIHVMMPAGPPASASRLRAMSLQTFDDIIDSLLVSIRSAGTLYLGFGGYQNPNPSGTFKSIDDGATWVRQPFGVGGFLIVWEMAA